MILTIRGSSLETEKTLTVMMGNMLGNLYLPTNAQALEISGA